MDEEHLLADQIDSKLEKGLEFEIHAWKKYRQSRRPSALAPHMLSSGVLSIWGLPSADGCYPRTSS